MTRSAETFFLQNIHVTIQFSFLQEGLAQFFMKPPNRDPW